MRNIYTVFLGLILFPLQMMAQQDMLFKIYDKTGTEVSFEQMMLELKKADGVFFGEYHNNSVAHWFELIITEKLFEFHGKELILGAEMFESDDQLILDEYLAGMMEEKNFELEAKLWNNYKTDYRPLVEFAKEKGLRFIATNIPRRYAAYVHKRGGLASLDSLSKEAKKYIAPLPVIFYENIYMPMFMGMGMQGAMSKSPSKTEEHASQGMLQIAHAQAVKDATMAWFLSENMKKNTKFVHFNGSMHSDKYQGIISYLKEFSPKLSIATVTTVEQDDISVLNEAAKAKADFIICVHTSATKTY